MVINVLKLSVGGEKGFYMMGFGGVYTLTSFNKSVIGSSPNIYFVCGSPYNLVYGFSNSGGLYIYLYLYYAVPLFNFFLIRTVIRGFIGTIFLDSTYGSLLISLIIFLFYLECICWRTKKLSLIIF